MFYNLTNRDGEASLSVIAPEAGFEKVVASNHPNFDTLLSYLVHTPSDQVDVERVRSLVDPLVAIGKALATVTTRMTADLHNLYFDGRRLEGVLERHILRMLHEGDEDFARFVRFRENLDANPSRKAQQAVFQWIENNGLTITEDGYFLGYKGVREDGYSKSSGPNNYVDGVLYENGADAHVPHEVGSVISKHRADVDDNTSLACSHGLHVGTQEYASGFAPRLLTVVVNPADVVSVPDSDLDYKIRVCKYTVLELADPRSYERASYTPATTSVSLDTECPQCGGTGDADENNLNQEPGDDCSECDGTGFVSVEADVEDESDEDEDWSGEDLGDEDEVTADEMQQAIEFPERSDRHVWEGNQQAEYNSLAAPGRTLYDNLRTQFDKTHDAAFAAAVESFGTKEDRLAEVQANLEPQAGDPQATVAENAAVLPALKADLEDRSLGHKPLARKWAHLTTEASVRRYRKANGITLTLATRVSEALS